MLTDEVKAKAEELFGEEFTTIKLRLLPYLHHVMLNKQKLDLHLINEEERVIISGWREKGFLTGGAAAMTITREFWDNINDIWQSYLYSLYIKDNSK